MLQMHAMCLCTCVQNVSGLRLWHGWLGFLVTKHHTPGYLWYGGCLPSHLACITDLELDLSLGLYVCVCQRRPLSQVQCIYRREPNQMSTFHLSHLQIYTWSVCPCSSFNILARSHLCKSTRETDVNVGQQIAIAQSHCTCLCSVVIVNPSPKGGDRVS